MPELSDISLMRGLHSLREKRSLIELVNIELSGGSNYQE